MAMIPKVINFPQKMILSDADADILMGHMLSRPVNFKRQSPEDKLQLEQELKQHGIYFQNISQAGVYRNRVIQMKEAYNIKNIRSERIALYKTGLKMIDMAAEIDVPPLLIARRVLLSEFGVRIMTFGMHRDVLQSLPLTTWIKKWGAHNVTDQDYFYIRTNPNIHHEDLNDVFHIFIDICNNLDFERFVEKWFIYKFSKRDFNNLRACANADDYTNPCCKFQSRSKADAYEREVGKFLESHRVHFWTENQLKQNGYPITPDFVFTEPIVLNGELCFWLDAKCSFGCHTIGPKYRYSQLAKQGGRYNAAFGQGAFVYAHGYAPRLQTNVGVRILDGSFLYEPAQKANPEIFAFVKREYTQI